MKPYKYTPMSDEELDREASLYPVSERLITQAKRANALLGMVEHAIELGYLGEGSTAHWAKRLVADYKGETPT